MALNLVLGQVKVPKSLKFVSRYFDIFSFWFLYTKCKHTHKTTTTGRYINQVLMADPLMLI